MASRPECFDGSNRGIMKPGTQVEWTKIKRQGSGFIMSQMYGTLLGVDRDVATVKLRNGHTRIIKVVDLHETGSGPNQLTRIMDAMAKHREPMERPSRIRR